MDIITITGLCIIATIIIKLFEKSYREYSLLLLLGISVVILIIIISCLAPIIKSINDIFSISNVSTSYLTIIFKAIGVCYLTQLGCDYCKDAGESTMASELELAGKVTILIIALPLFGELIEIIKKLLTL